MPIGIKEAKMGLYRAVETGATYMALDAKEWSEYLDLQKKYKKLMSDYKNLKKDHAEKVAYAQKVSDLIGRANQYIEDGEEKDQLIGQLREENEQLKEDNATYKATARNMLRIQRERANAERKLKPKKEHPGYLVLSQERLMRKPTTNCHNQHYIYKSVLQTPCDASMTREVAWAILRSDLKKFLLHDLDITEWCPDDVRDYNVRDYVGQQTVFDFECKQNYRSRLYEMVIYHSQEFIFPEYMKK